MKRVEMRRQLKAIAERDNANVIRISFIKDNGFTIATMYTIDKEYDLIFKKVFYSYEKSDKLYTLENRSGLMVLRKDYVECKSHEERRG